MISSGTISVRCAGVVALLVLSGDAKTFFVDPPQGSITNDGSAGRPWSTLRQVFDSNKIETRMYQTKPASPASPLVAKNPGAPVKAGDTLILRNGYHGEIFAGEYYNRDYITIAAEQGHTPKLASLELRSGCKWIVKGVTISPSFAPSYVKKTLLRFSSHNWTGPSRDCIAEACTAYSVPDASAWTKAQWDTLSCDGMSLPGNGMTARGNYFKNVNFGIVVVGDSCLVEYNTIEKFAGDGLRGLGNYGTFQYNIVKNCYDVNANHDDGFQSWSVGPGGVGTGVVRGIVLRGNTIVNYENPNQPFRGTLQGIGCFDGMFEDWLVVNNVVRTDHWHGISLYGATSCVVINNTVVDCNDATPGPPWIMIRDHKNGTPSTGCVVRNNLSTAFSSSGQGVASDHNITVTGYDAFFVNYPANDLRLKKGCAAVDSGSPLLAPAFDRNGNPRPQGAGIDVGAYELGVMPVIGISGKKNCPGRPRPRAGAANPVIVHFDEAAGTVILIYTIKGTLVREIPVANGSKAAWNTARAPGGIYIAKISTGNACFTDKIVLPR